MDDRNVDLSTENEETRKPINAQTDTENENAIIPTPDDEIIESKNIIIRKPKKDPRKKRIIIILCAAIAALAIALIVYLALPKPALPETPPEPVCAHNPVIIPSIPPTTTMTGLTEGKMCSLCGEILVPQETIPMLVPDTSITTSLVSDSNGIIHDTVPSASTVYSFDNDKASSFVTLFHFSFLSVAVKSYGYFSA